MTCNLQSFEFPAISCAARQKKKAPHIVKSSKYDHISLVLQYLHWLPIAWSLNPHILQCCTKVRLCSFQVTFFQQANTSGCQVCWLLYRYLLKKRTTHNRAAKYHAFSLRLTHFGLFPCSHTHTGMLKITSKKPNKNIQK